MTWADHGKRPGPKPKRPKGRQPCTFPDCGRQVKGHGLCMAHYMQRQRGVELRPIRPPKPTAEPGTLWCGHCRKFRDEDEFGWDPTRNQPKRTCRPCLADYQIRWTNDNKEQVNLRRRLKKRGLTEQQYRALLDRQQGRCAICGKQRPLDIDHCHARGHVRGLLCSPCNRGLGFFEDDPVVIKAALRYLKPPG